MKVSHFYHGSWGFEDKSWKDRNQVDKAAVEL
jgi:hypothetical protein